MPVAMLGASAFFALLVVTMIAWRVAWDPWWVVPITLALAGLAVMFLRIGVGALRSRDEQAVLIEEGSFSFGGLAIPRESVKVVRYDSDALFKGTRVELLGGSFLRLPAHLHRPGRILRTFRRAKYPVE